MNCVMRNARSIDAPLGNAGEDPLADLSWD